MPSSDLAARIARAREIAEEATSRNWDNGGFPSPLPWRVSTNPVPMIWADDGDAVVMQMPNGEPYFEKPTARVIALAVNALPALLDVAEAGRRLQIAYSPDGLTSEKLPAWDAFDSALARLAEVLP